MEFEKNDLIKIIQFCYNSSYFKFNDKIYKQLDGMAMGNPASPVLANFVMYDLLNWVVAKLPFHPPLLKLYVDDIIMAVPHDQVESVLSTFNHYHQRLQFTYEKETDCKLPFLDIEILRERDGTLRTQWYQKGCHSGRILNYKSHHPIHQKLATATNLIHRCLSLTHHTLHNTSIQKVHCILNNNNYPTSLIKQITRNIKKRLKSNTISPVDKNSKTIYCKFPFIKNLTPHLNKCFNHTTTKLAFYNINTTKQLYTKLKDKNTPEEISSVVYSIPCLNCNKKYIGQSKQYALKRIKQHKQSCNAININKSERTALADHHFKEGHNLDFNNYSILDIENNYKKRLISEMINIKINNSINKKADTDNLSKVYDILINQIHKK